MTVTLDKTPLGELRPDGTYAAPAPQHTAEHVDQWAAQIEAWAAAMATVYAGVRGVVTRHEQWDGHADGTATTHLQQPGDDGTEIGLVYVVGPAHRADDWGRLTGLTLCPHGIYHQSHILSPRDIAHLEADAMVCTAHAPIPEPAVEPTQFNKLSACLLADADRTLAAMRAAKGGGHA